MLNKFLLFFLIFFSIYGFDVFSQNWELKTEKDEVEVFTREVDSSEMDEFKGVTVIDAPIEVITELLRDVKEYGNWIYNCKNAELLEKQTRNNFVIYYVYDSPWPVDDRWIVLKSESTIDCENMKVTIKMFGVENAKQGAAGMVKMKKMLGDYTLEYIERNKTRVSYTMFVDPGGSVPASLANMSSIDIPLETLLEMKKMVKKEKYKKAAIMSIDKDLIEECLSKHEK